jgi:hypothetical protein
MMKQGLLNCIRALGGYTVNTSAKTVYATVTFDEDKYLEAIPDSEGSTLIGLTSYAYVLPFSFQLPHSMRSSYNAYKASGSKTPLSFSLSHRRSSLCSI